MIDTDIVQRLIGQREGDVDVDSLFDKLADAGLLTDRQSEAIVRYHLTDDSVATIAAEMDVSESRVYNARQDAERRLEQADATLRVLREAIRELDEQHLTETTPDGSEQA